MAEALIFHYLPGSSPLHRIDVRVKLAGMICLSLILISASAFKFLTLLPLLGFLHLSQRAGRGREQGSPFFIIMPLIIFTGNFLSLTLSAGESVSAGLQTALMRTLRFIYILWIAHLFTRTTDPLTITPAFYFFLNKVPFIPAGRISTQMGLSLTLIPLILDEMSEIRDAMKSRCGWSPRRPVRNLIHMGLPLLEGVLRKAEELSDAMESRLYNEEATGPEILTGNSRLIPILILLFLITFYTAVDNWAESHGFITGILQNY